MRKLATAGVIAAAALSWAHVARAEDAAQKRQDAAKATQEEMKQDARDARQKTQQEAQQAREGMSDTANRAGTKMQHARAAGAQQTSLFEGKSNFDVEGKLSKVSQNSITIQRQDLPAATLKVSKQTKIEVDGQKASVGQLRQGANVKASFNLQEDKPVAVEIKSEKVEGQSR
jgi:colicin import membrane protein